MKKMILLCVCLAGLNAMGQQRVFKHPGISYTQADIDRMRAMVDAGQEPYYSAFLEFKESRYTTYRDYERPLPVHEGQPVIWDNPNLWLDEFGQVAFHNAMMWKLTDETSYADKAVAVLNRYAPVRSIKPYGTNCLDASKATMLIEAAELLRDYEGWKPEDQQGFKDFLVSPGYSTVEDYYAKYSSSDTLENRVTVYWNIFQGDPGRHGNQGLYGLRTLMAMGIYLDNDTIYERAYRKLLSLSHRQDDLPYPKGPKIPHGVQSHVNDEYYILYDASKITVGEEEDYGYDDELKYWIWENGQCQEASRDQGHIMDGMCNMVDIARTAWNQGDDVFSAYGGRILQGITYAAKYNYGWYNREQMKNKYWPEEELFEPTVENGQFIRRMARCARWEGLKINPWSEGNQTDWTRGKQFHSPGTMWMQYKVRMGLPADSLLWVQRAFDVKKAEDGSMPGGLLDYRTVWMAGDGGTFVDGRHVSGLPALPGTIRAVDYDFYSLAANGEGLTYHDKGTEKCKLYRTDGTVEIETVGDSYVVTGMEDGEWMNYSFTVAKDGYYRIWADAEVSVVGGALYAAVDNGTAVGGELPVGQGFQEHELGVLRLRAGASVLRMTVKGTDNAVRLRSIRVEETARPSEETDYVWNSRDCSTPIGKGEILTDQSDKLLVSNRYASELVPTFTVVGEPMEYHITSDKLYLAIHGMNLNMVAFQEATYRLPGGMDDETKASTSGQAATYSVKGCGAGGDEQLFVWQLDSSANRRIEPLLGDCYAEGVEAYTLKGLCFAVNGESLYKDTRIDDIGFYTLEELMARYGEDLKDTPLTVPRISMECEGSPAVYRIDGTRVPVDTSRPDWRVALPGGIYVVDGKKLVLP